MGENRPIWFEAYSSEVLQSWRSLQKRKEESPFITAWFGVLLVVFIGMILAVTHYSIETGTEFLAVDAGAIVTLVFFLFIAKSLANTTRRVTKQNPLVFYLSQPHHPSDFLIGLLCGEIFFNLGLLALVSGIAYLEIFIMQLSIFPNPMYFAQIILAIVCASILGFIFAVFNSVQPLKKRIPLIVLVSGGASVFYTILDNFATDPRSVLLMTIPLAIASTSLYPAFKLFPEAWNWATSAATGLRKSVYERTTGKFAPKIMRWIGWDASLVLEKELVEKVRSKEVIGSSIAVAAVSMATIYSLGKTPSFEFIPDFVARVLPPLVVGMGLFVGTILEPGMAALGAFGKDGNSTWIFKNGPVAPREIVKAKAVGALYAAPFLAVFAGTVPTLWAGYSWIAGAFAGILGMAIAFYAVGTGIWLGAKAPNFDPSVKGYPDVVTIYIYAMMCLGICIVVCAIALAAAFYYPVLGLLIAIFIADMGALFLYGGIKAGAKEFGRMEAP